MSCGIWARAADPSASKPGYWCRMEKSWPLKSIRNASATSKPTGCATASGTWKSGRHPSRRTRSGFRLRTAFLSAAAADSRNHHPFGSQVFETRGILVLNTVLGQSDNGLDHTERPAWLFHQNGPDSGQPQQGHALKPAVEAQNPVWIIGGIIKP